MRKATTKTLVESGATNSELMAVSGHKAYAMFRFYAEEVDQIVLGEAAMDKWKANQLAPKKVLLCPKCPKHSPKQNRFVSFVLKTSSKSLILLVRPRGVEPLLQE